MKKYLLAPFNHYKANLHSHSTVSDGKLPVAEVVKAYKEKGYSILAMTDHEILRDHSVFSDKDFVMITAYEMTIREGTKTTNTNKVTHLNLYARNPHNVRQVQFDKSLSLRYAHYGDEVPFDIETLEMATPSDERTHTTAYANKLIREAGENGFIVCYNHPTWSNEEKEDFVDLEGCVAMEIVNYGSLVEGLWEYNVHEYDAMLKAGKKVACFASDDNHNAHPFDHPCCDSFGGWTVLVMPELTYDNVIKAMEQGDCYASTGPSIEEIYYDTEDGLVHIKTSPVARIILNSQGRRRSIAVSPDGSPITEAALPIVDDAGFVRVTLDDGKGKYAFSRGYFLDEFM